MELFQNLLYASPTQALSDIRMLAKHWSHRNSQTRTQQCRMYQKSTRCYLAILIALPWVMITAMKSNKSQCWILLLGQSSIRQKHMLWEEWLESSPAQRDLGVLVGSQCEPDTSTGRAEAKPYPGVHHHLGKRGIVPLYSVQVWCHLKNLCAFLCPAVEEGLWMHPEEGDKAGGVGWKECPVTLGLSYLE